MQVRKPMEGYSGAVLRSITASPIHAPVTLPHGVPGSTKTVLGEGGVEFVLDRATSDGGDGGAGAGTTVVAPHAMRSTA